MKQSLKHLSSEQRERLNEVKKIIASIAAPEKIVLFGLHANQDAPIILLEFPPALQIFDLLVIVKRGDTKDIINLQTKVEEKCFGIASTNIIVHHLKYVNERLMEGSCFFRQIQEKGIILYEASQIPLVPAATPNILKIKNQAVDDFKEWSTKAREYYDCARYGKEYGYRRLSMFLLHQAAEQMYQAIILTHDGYKPTTHNLGKLRKHTARLSLELCLIFSDQTDCDQRLFYLLLNSYINARYTKHFDVAENDLAILLDRVGRLLTVGEAICLRHIDHLGKPEDQHKLPNKLSTAP